MRRTSACLLTAGLLLFAGGSAPAAEMAIGSIQTASNREGAWMRDDPRPLAKKLVRVPFEAKVKVVALREMWARVTTEAEPVTTGWIRVTDLVEPASLAGGAASSVSLGSSEVSAAGRQFRDASAGKQFDRKSEGTYRTMDEAMNAAYATVDKLEREAPTDAEIEAFIREGLLGGTGVAGSPTGQGSYAKLDLLGATGTTEGVTTFEDAYTPMPTPTSDSDFVQRLGVGLKVDQEYWLGRAVAAAAIVEYGLDPDPKRQRLVQLIGGSIAMLSDRLRATHGGYHFAVLNTPIPNGISGPGGFIFLTRGAIDLARNEDEVAGIVAHEMAHIAYRHGEQMLRQTREFQAELKKLEARVQQGPTAGLECNLCGEMARALGTAAKAMSDTLKEQGYGRDYELAADWAGSLFLCEVGYRASAIAEYLEMLPSREGARWTKLPGSEERIEALRPLVFKHGCPFETDDGAQARLPRFRAVMGAASPSAPTTAAVGATSSAHDAAAPKLSVLPGNPTGAALVVGSALKAFEPEGAWIREEPNSSAKRVMRALSGSTMKVLELRDEWARVSMGADPASVGWVRVVELGTPSNGPPPPTPVTAPTPPK
jgi:beta-barrel assembly-enhancing protease